MTSDARESDGARAIRLGEGTFEEEGDGPLLAVILAVCPDEYAKAFRPLVDAAIFQISVDPLLGDALHLAGPLALPKPNRWRLFGQSSDSAHVRDGLRDRLNSIVLDRDARVALGVIFIEPDVDAVDRAISECQSAQELVGLPVQFRGISLTPILDAEREDMVGINASLGPVRFDHLLLDMCRSILATAQTSSSMTMTSGILTRAIGAGSVASSPEEEVTAARLADDEVAETHSALVATTHAPSRALMPESGTIPEHHPRHLPHANDKYAVAEGLPVRLTYLVLAMSSESRPSRVRSRVVALARALDRELVPLPGTIASRTVLVAAGQGETRSPVMRVTGNLVESDFWKPAADFLDMTRTMEELVRLVTENIASFERRSQPLVRPLVIFVMPTAAMAGARCLSHYRKLKDLGDIGWIITEKDTTSPSSEVDLHGLVVDKEDVVNELLHAMAIDNAAREPRPRRATLDQQAASEPQSKVN